MKDVINCPYIMNAVEIKGNAILCFEENGYQFQGIIQTDNNAQYTVYGTRSKRREARKMSRVLCEKEIEQCGCEDEIDGPGVPVMYDIKIVDCEMGDEYSLRRVHGRNGKEVTIRCKCITFNTSQTYKGQRAEMEAHKILGSKFLGRGGKVYEGPIQLTADSDPEESRPWVL
ncbi:UNVERIFIED_CONTAM: hypothetical protein RMT77_000291 [Armadillidium vulgare]|nr:hypothetical protein Avbf_00872 [Armadillidium vulgare]